MNNRINLYELKKHINPKQIVENTPSPVKRNLFAFRPANYIPITETIKNTYFFVIKIKKTIKNKI